ncbi:MAG: helix-turn-helix transcriptional regulator [Victivallaceae bacterium]
MEQLVRHFAGLPRRLRATPPLESIGFIPGKQDRVRRVFATFNFSFIMSGRGYYNLDGVRHEVCAPAVIIQWPGEPMDYAPEPTWDELYLIYPADAGQWLERAGLFRPDRFLWQIEKPAAITALVNEFHDLCIALGGTTYADLADLAAWHLVVESLLARPGNHSLPYREELRNVAQRLRNFPENHYDFDDLAVSLGMSRSSFRRYFKIYYQLPPGEYLQSCRIGRARRELVESSRSIGEIARRCGFDDPLYFSRRFRLECGMTPGEYRRRYRVFP